MLPRPPPPTSHQHSRRRGAGTTLTQRLRVSTLGTPADMGAVCCRVHAVAAHHRWHTITNTFPGVSPGKRFQTPAPVSTRDPGRKRATPATPLIRKHTSFSTVSVPALQPACWRHVRVVLLTPPPPPPLPPPRPAPLPVASTSCPYHPRLPLEALTCIAAMPSLLAHVRACAQGRCG